MSFDSPTKKSRSTTASPTGETRSYTARPTVRPRTPSMIAKAMWPPSSGSSGSRLSRASDRLIRPSTQR